MWSPSAAGRRCALTRRSAGLLLVFVVASSLALRAWRYDHSLPSIFESDWVQVQQAAELLRDGTYIERSSYPATHTFAYAAAHLAAYGFGRIVGAPYAPSWEVYVRRLQGPEIHHAIGRLYGAVLGSLLAVAVYRLARLRLPRSAALVAAAAAALSPASVAYSHQARIHVPGITLLVFAAIPVTRLALERPTAARALAAGAAAGAVASVFQLGYVLLGAALATLALAARPLVRAAGLGAAATGAFAAVVGAVALLVHLSGTVDPASTPAMASNPWSLGIPNLWSWLDPLERLPAFVLGWGHAEPAVAVCAAPFVALALLRRGEVLRTLAAYGLYPALVLAALGAVYTAPRYSLSLTPFLAILAAALWTTLRGGWRRAALGAVLVGLPLASSIRYGALLGEPDSRLLMVRSLPDITSAGLSVSVEDMLAKCVLPPGVDRFPPAGDFRSWVSGQTTPALSLAASGVDVHLRAARDEQPLGLASRDLERLGYELRGRIRAARTGNIFLPDVTPRFLVDLWTTPLGGPTIELWVRRPRAGGSAEGRALEHVFAVYDPGGP